MKSLTKVTPVPEFWAVYYHVFEYLKKNPDTKQAKKIYPSPVVDHFHDWMNYQLLLDIKNK